MLNWKSLSETEKNAALQRPALQNTEELSDTVATIIETVRNQGDLALRAFTSQFDQVSLDDLTVSSTETLQAMQALDPQVKGAIDKAYQTISQFHTAQRQADIEEETSPGVLCTLRVRPMQAVGLYVPGGNTPLVSTALMLGVPAQIAQCPSKIMVSPPDQNGKIAPEIIYAASCCGIDTIYKVGGAQAIAALAFGTETIDAVDKIYGPGNRYVTEAKRQVSQVQGLVGIDIPAGPSEVLVIADSNAKASYVAADLLAQAEHGPDSQVILVSNDPVLIGRIEVDIQQQLNSLERRTIAAEALQQARFILVSSIEEAVQLSNRYAPEHLILNVNGPENFVEQVTHAGSIFLGVWTPECAGDYASGTNHVLPTYGAARYTNSLSLRDFQKVSTIQRFTRAGLAGIGQTIMALAGAEGLGAHSRSISIRMEDIPG